MDTLSPEGRRNDLESDSASHRSNEKDVGYITFFPDRDEKGPADPA